MFSSRLILIYDVKLPKTLVAIQWIDSSKYLFRDRHSHYTAVTAQSKRTGNKMYYFVGVKVLTVVLIPAAARRRNQLCENSLGGGRRRRISNNLNIYIRQAAEIRVMTT